MNLTLETTPVGPNPTLDSELLAGRTGGKVVERLEDAFIARNGAERNLARLLSEGALCVTTGQQPGLLLGPLYTLYKAASAVALARALEVRLGRPVVPVFWVAGDDHDFRESNHSHLLAVTNEVRTLTLRDRDPAAPLTPLYREQLGSGIEAILASVVEATPDTEFRGGVIRWLETNYTRGADFASAFAGGVADLLGGHGLVVFTPTHQSAKRAMLPWLSTALRDAKAIDRALLAHASQLREGGATVPIPVGDGATGVMIEASMGRDRLVADGTSFVARRSGERFSLDDLEAIARDEPERLSPNVLLRPVVEAAILPTLAYVAGPGELAYLPQAGPIYEILGVPRQCWVARWGGRVMESRVTKVLEKYGVGPDELNAPEGQLEARIVGDELPAAAAEALATLRAVLDSQYDRLVREVESLDPTLKKPVESARHGALRGVTDVEKRLISHLKKRNDTAVQQLAKARVNLFPLGRPQERVLSPIPFLIRYGDAFVDAVVERCSGWYRDLETASGET